MLERYDGKRVRVTTAYGDEISGTAEAFSSGYGLREFGIEEESLKINGTQLFHSQIESIDVLSVKLEEADPDRYMSFMETMLEMPYWIADILPAQVPEKTKGQYFKVDRYFSQPERITALHRRKAEILLRMNCYYDMAVTYDSCRTWEINPDPQSFADRMSSQDGEFVRVLFQDQDLMIDIDPNDTWMTVYAKDGELPDILQKLIAAEGFFLWKGEGNN